MKKNIIDDVLDGIHYLLKINNLKLSEEVIKYADNEILKYIEENVVIDENRYKIVHHGGAVFLSDPNMQDVLMRYVAIVNDNVSLLDKLNKVGYNFHKGHNYYNLFVFDKRLSSRFKEDKYVKLLNEYSNVFRRFYNSLRFIEEDEVDSVLDDFAYIIKKTPRILKFHDQEIDEYGAYSNGLLTGQNIKIYGKEFLINSNNNQRKIINSINFSLTDEQLKKLMELLNEYPNFVPKLKITPKLLDMFTTLEIVSMTDKDARLYSIAFERGLEDRLHELLLLDSDFDCSDKFMQEEIFKVLDNETIISLSEEGMKEISEIKIPKMKNVIVMPIKKINKIVERDKKHKVKINKVKMHTLKLGCIWKL